MFAEKAKRLEVWAKVLEGYDVSESKQVMEWQAQALERGRELGRELGWEEGELVGRIQTYQEMLNQPISPREDLRQQSRDDLTRMVDQLKRQILPRTNGHS